MGKNHYWFNLKRKLLQGQEKETKTNKSQTKLNKKPQSNQ